MNKYYLTLLMAISGLTTTSVSADSLRRVAPPMPPKMHTSRHFTIRLVPELSTPHTESNSSWRNAQQRTKTNSFSVLCFTFSKVTKYKRD